MRENIEERAVRIGNYIVETNKTIRQAMTELGYSKSTIHKDLRYRLPDIDPDLSYEVAVIMERHKAVRHINGGKATHDKFEMIRTAC
jgi:putative DeoR family transcriptional regulator (stage III sporulation protein D)